MPPINGKYSLRYILKLLLQIALNICANKKKQNVYHNQI
ncbi:hypothetical protein M080_1361 [Bacteroides fragilis str. 3397 T10]|nr:hypothetical protein M080_1361 [Bacteroides fragilis str. 3397 T10]